MAVVENAGGLDLGINVNVGSSSAPAPSTRPTFVPVDENHLRAARMSSDPPPPYLQKQQQQQNNQSFHIKLFEKQQQQQQMNAVSNQNHLGQVQFQQHNNNNNNNNGNSIHKSSSNGGTLATANSGFRNFHQRSNSGSAVGEAGGEGFKRDMRELEDLLSKLNPMAQEFVPLSHANSIGSLGSGDFYAQNNFLVINGNNKIDNAYSADANTTRRKKNNYNQGKRRINSRTGMAQREEIIRRTVYVSDIDQQVTEEQLAALFINCGQVVDCRICGDPNSVLRFAFIEFTDDVGARAALSLSGTMLGYYPVRVLPSKTAIAPVNPTFLPRSEDEREMCVRTIYCTNIDKQVSQADVKLFFESICGTVYRLRLLGDYHHSTRIAFVEFVMAESAIAALNCSGVVLGSLPIRVSPSKTPVRPRAPRPQMH